MKIDTKKCQICGKCIPFCPMGAIRMGEKKIVIEQDECVECGVCIRPGICPKGAFVREVPGWPRILRAEFSDPTIIHKKTCIPGRGTAEMKTNDVSGRFRKGEVGVAVELGRPGTGTRLREVEKITRELALIKVFLEEQNPLTALVQDRTTGVLYPEILDEKVLSVIVEFKVPLQQLQKILELLQRVLPNLDTVASIGFIGRSEKDGSIPVEQFLIRNNIYFRPNGKVNVGLGRPLSE